MSTLAKLFKRKESPCAPDELVEPYMKAMEESESTIAEAIAKAAKVHKKVQHDLELVNAAHLNSDEDVTDRS